MIEQRVMLLVATRGRRGTTPAEHVRAMAEMAVRARCLAQSRPDIYPQTRVIPVIMQLIAARVSFASLVHNGFSRPHDGVFPQFDSVLRNMDASLTRNEWRTAVHELNEVLDILNANPTYVLGNVKGEELANLAMRHKVSGQDEEEEGEGQEEKGGEETAHTMGGGSASLSLENIKKLAGVGDSLMKGEDGETAQLSSTEQLSDGRTMIRVVGDVCLIFSRLAADYVKNLRKLDPFSMQFIDRVSDEQILIALSEKTYNYYLRAGDLDAVATIALASGDELTRAIAATSDPEAEHDLVALGVIPEEILKKAKENLRREGIETAGLGAGAGAGESEEAAAAALGDTGCVVKGYVFLGDVQGKDSGAGIARAALKKAWTQWRKNRDEDADEENDSDAPKLREWMVVDGAAGDIDDAMNRLGRVVYRLGEARLKTRTMLCQIYHHAVHDRVDKARELLLMSRIQDIILHTNDVLTQVLYNRALTQVGLACFREGRYRQAYFALRDLAATNNPMYARERMRELLAQGTGRQKRSEEEEKEERRRRIP
ncbi:TIF3C1, partial [Symbiodinium sp. KB8]